MRVFNRQWLCGVGMLIGLSFSIVHAAEKETLINIDAGYRIDQVDWTIAGDTDGQNPNILSELTWDELQIAELKASGGVDLGRLRLGGSLGYGYIFSGDNRDSDYAGDGRTQEFSRSDNQAEGNVIDLEASLGMPFELSPWGEFQNFIMPLVGVSIHQQNLGMTHGFQAWPATGAFSGLDSSYDAEWQSGWLGLSMWNLGARGYKVGFDISYHIADYTAEADWNLRTDFAHPKSFEHAADGRGVTLNVYGVWPLSDRLFFKSGVRFRDWTTDPGVDRTFMADGSTGETQLNEVNWRSTGINLGVEYRM